MGLDNGRNGEAKERDGSVLHYMSNRVNLIETQYFGGPVFRETKISEFQQLFIGEL